MFSLSSSGGFENTEAFLNRASTSSSIVSLLSPYGQAGVNALAAATPVEEGVTASSWYYEVVRESTGYSIIWGNSNINDGQIIAVLLQMGHGTRNGGYVEGRDYINPALQPIFDKLASEAWKAVIA